MSSGPNLAAWGLRLAEARGESPRRVWVQDRIEEHRREARHEIHRRLAAAAWREGLLGGAPRIQAGRVELGPFGRWSCEDVGPFGQPRLRERLSEPPSSARALAESLGELDPQLSATARGRLRDELRSAEETDLRVRLWSRARISGWLPGPPAADGEHEVPGGHPWHPMAKTRRPLRDWEQWRYAPEFLAETPLKILALDTRLLNQAGEVSRFEALFQQWGLPSPPKGHTWFPVHPAQARLLSRPGKSDAAALGAALRSEAPLKFRPGPNTRSLLSLRSVELPDRAHHLKLSVDIQTTSARRIVSPMSVSNGPRLSRWLLDRWAAVGSEGLRLWPESASMGLRAETFGSDARQLGCILRPLPHEARGARLVTASLFDGLEKGTAHLRRLVRGSGGPAAYLEHTIEHLVRPGIACALELGVVLELHQQNVLVQLHKGGRPGCFWVRDLGGVRIDASHWRERGWELELAPGSFLVAPSPREFWGKLGHSLLQCQLGVLVPALETYGLPATESWARISDCLRRELDPSRYPAAQAARARTGADTLLGERILAKALLTMRMRDRVSDYDYVPVPNPLASS